MATDKQKADENYERYVYARDNGHTDFLKNRSTYYDFVRGVQWSDELRARLAAEGRPALTFNKILPSVAVIMAEQLRNRADISFKPLKDGSQDVANALTKTFLQIQHNTKLHRKESMVFQDGAISDRGYFDVDISFNDQMMGEVAIRQERSNNVLLDPDTDSYDPAEWQEVMVSRWLTEGQLKRSYGEEKAKAVAQREGSCREMGYDFVEEMRSTVSGDTIRDADQENPHRRYRILKRQYRVYENREHFVDLMTGDMRVVPKNMDRNKVSMLMKQFNLGIVEKMVDTVMISISAEDILLFEAERPINRFTIIPYFPFYFDGRPLGLVANQIDPQLSYNKTRSQELHIVNTTANSGWKVKAGSLQNMDIEDLEERGSETGLVMELDDVDAAQKILPNTVPTGLDRISHIAAEDLKEISMASDSMRGFDRADVAAKAIRAKQVRGSDNFASPMDNLAYTRELLADHVLELVQKFYTEERLIKITGNALMPQDEELIINEITPEGEVLNDLTLGEYAVVVTSTPARDTFEESQFDEAVTLRNELGVAIPDEYMIKYSHLADKAELAERVKELTGGGEPTEAEQQVAQLEMEIKALEKEKLQAEKDHTESQTALNLVRAQQTADEANRPPEQPTSGGPNIDVELLKLENERDRDLQDAKLKKYQIDRELKYKYDALAVEREKMNKQAEKPAPTKLKTKEAENA